MVSSFTKCIIFDYFSDPEWFPLDRIKTENDHWEVSKANLQKVYDSLISYIRAFLKIPTNFVKLDIQGIVQGKNEEQLLMLCEHVLGVVGNCRQKDNFIDGILQLNQQTQTILMEIMLKYLTHENQSPSIDNEYVEILRAKLKDRESEFITMMNNQKKIEKENTEFLLKINSLEEIQFETAAENLKLKREIDELHKAALNTKFIERENKLKAEIEKYKNQFNEQNIKLEEEAKIKLKEISQRDDELFILKEKIKKLLDEHQQKIKNIMNGIETNSKKFEEYVTKISFNTEIYGINNDIRTFENKLNSLSENINPYALLKSDTISQCKDTPDAFLKYLFDLFKDDAKFMIKKQDEKIKYMETIMTTLKKNLNTNLYLAAKKAVNQLKAKGELENTISDNSEIIDLFQTTISKKCDYSELQFLDNLKANKKDLEGVNSLVDKTNNKISYIFELLNEFIQIIINNEKYLNPEKATKLSYLAYQFSLISKSIKPNEYLKHETQQIDAVVNENSIKSNPMTIQSSNNSIKRFNSVCSKEHKDQRPKTTSLYEIGKCSKSRIERCFTRTIGCSKTSYNVYKKIQMKKHRGISIDKRESSK